MRSRTLIIILLFLLMVGGAFFFGASSYLLFSSGSSDSIFEGGNVGLVKVEEGIYDSYDIVRELDEYRKDDDVRAVVVRIDSPGGSVAASQEIYDAVKRLSDKKPVVASMGIVAASGGYYVACGANKIIANPGTITGSIGVRIEHFEIGDLLRWAKVNHEALTSGKYKDIISFDKPLTPDERQIVNEMLGQIHQQFKTAVRQSRGLSEEEIEKIADGRVFTGEQAKNLGLVDSLGGLYEAVNLAGEMANIKGEPGVTEKHKKRKGWSSEFFEGGLNGLKDLFVEGKNKKGGYFE